METILIVEDREGFAQMLSQALADAGYQTVWAKDGKTGIDTVCAGGIDLVVTDLKLPGKDGLEVLHRVKAYRTSIPVILMTAHGSIETAVKAVKEGAYDFIAKPFDPDHLLLQIGKALEKQRLVTENAILKTQTAGVRMIGNSLAMTQVVSQVQKVSGGKTTVLLHGESGTGKEVIARMIHGVSPRHDKAFVPINCAAIPRELLESELFGHERGAFTGAVEKRIGRFELADKGTLFLDEIGDMDLPLQAKILRVLEEGSVMRVGGVASVKIDVRLIAATHRNLPEAIQQGRFRSDLYFRLNVFPITLPPLRERREDIPPLATHFIAHYCNETSRPTKHLSPAALDLMMNHHWAGNVRELQNGIERAVILSDGDEITPEHLALRVRHEEHLDDITLEGPLAQVAEAASRQVETKMIRKVLKATGGNKSRASEILQVSYKTLLTKIKDYEIEKEA
jgi:DNA-binding NtrC family response regulator